MFFVLEVQRWVKGNCLRGRQYRVVRESGYMYIRRDDDVIATCACDYEVWCLARPRATVGVLIL